MTQPRPRKRRPAGQDAARLAALHAEIDRRLEILRRSLQAKRAPTGEPPTPPTR